MVLLHANRQTSQQVATRTTQFPRDLTILVPDCPNEPECGCRYGPQPSHYIKHSGPNSIRTLDLNRRFNWVFCSSTNHSRTAISKSKCVHPIRRFWQQDTKIDRLGQVFIMGAVDRNSMRIAIARLRPGAEHDTDGTVGVERVGWLLGDSPQAAFGLGPGLIDRRRRWPEDPTT